MCGIRTTRRKLDEEDFKDKMANAKKAKELTVSNKEMQELEE